MKAEVPRAQDRSRAAALSLPTGLGASLSGADLGPGLGLLSRGEAGFTLQTGRSPNPGSLSPPRQG